MKRSILGLVSLFFIITSCDIQETIDELTTFEITNDAEFTIPSTSIVDVPIDISTPDVQSSSNQSFENNNTSADLIEEATLKSLTMQVLSPADRDFGFLKSVKIYISNNAAGEVLLAEKNNIAADIGSTLELETSGASLIPYITETTYDLRYEVVTDETINSETDIRADMVFEVRASTL